MQQLFAAGDAYFFDASAILLSVSSTNCASLLELTPLQDVLVYFSEYSSDDPFGRQEILALQCRLLSFLIFKGDMSQDKAIGQRIDKLRKAGLIGYDTARKLISILTLIPEKNSKENSKKTEPKRVEGEDYYAESTQHIAHIVEKLSTVIEDSHWRDRVLAVPVKIRTQKFSIGITGVMNAGKSTMLNALLGAELLGTAVVPETANLTVIKYASKPKAVVNFWSRKEWHEIELSAQTVESMGAFVAETKLHFAEGLADYVTDEGRAEEITVEALPTYTSAAQSHKRCNLVKSVTLYSDLKFVADGVEIVDTPGLDDPVVQREEITKAYLAECDLLCHLMNVGQSATQKDVSFIIESLLYRNVAQLLIVITRIDMVSEAELAEVIAYTKSSIKSRLEALSQGAKIEALIARIKFIPIAGKMALLHRTGHAEEAMASGYDLQKSGIPDIESYLTEVLFGDASPKVQLIMDAAHKELLRVAGLQKSAFLSELELLGKTAAEIEVAHAQHREEMAQAAQETETLYLQIAASKGELVEYLVLLKQMVREKFGSLGTLLGRRIMDDVRYSLRKEKKKPAPERTETMLAIGLQDGLIDLLREYRYQFGLRMDEAMEQIARRVDAFVPGDSQQEQEGAKAFFGKHFDALQFSDSHTVLITQVHQAITKAKPKTLEALDIALSGHFAEAMSRLEEKFWERAEEINAELLERFESRCKEPVEYLKQEREAQGRSLEKALRATQEGAAQTEVRRRDLTQRLETLSLLQSKLIREDENDTA